MNKRQKSRQYMLRNVIHFLDDNTSVWENESLVSGQINELKQFKTNLDELFSTEEQLSMPYAGIRDDEREEFNETFAQLSGVLHNMCSEAGRNDTAYFVSLTPRELMRDSLEKSVAKADGILKLATDFKDDLDAHPTAKAIHTKAQGLFDSFSRSMILPTERRKLRKQALLQIDSIQEQVLKFLEDRLDMNMRIFSSLKASFYRGYLDFRNVPKISGGRKKAGEDPGGGLNEAAEGDVPYTEGAADEASEEMMNSSSSGEADTSEGESA